MLVPSSHRLMSLRQGAAPAAAGGRHRQLRRGRIRPAAFAAGRMSCSGRLGKRRGSLLVLTFSPHLAWVLALHLAPPLISSVERKRSWRNKGSMPDRGALDRWFSQLTPEEFVHADFASDATGGLWGWRGGRRLRLYLSTRPQRQHRSAGGLPQRRRGGQRGAAGHRAPSRAAGSRFCSCRPGGAGSRKTARAGGAVLAMTQS